MALQQSSRDVSGKPLSGERTVKISKFSSHPNTFHGFTTIVHDEEDDSYALDQREEPLTPGTGEKDQWNKVKHQNEPLTTLNAHHMRTRAGSCWLRRTGRDKSRHTAAGGQKPDSDPQHFFSTGSSAAEAAVLLGEGDQEGLSWWARAFQDPCCEVLSGVVCRRLT